MPYPAYEGLHFYFSIPRGGPWRQEFRVIDRTANEITSWAGWSASLQITDDNGTVVATLSSAAGADGTMSLGDVALGPDAIVCALPAAFTVTLPATGTPAGQTTHPFLHAVLTLTDPDHPTEPYPFAVGKGVTRPLSL